MVSNFGCGSANQGPIACKSDGDISRDRQGADCAASNSIAEALRPAAVVGHGRAILAGTDHGRHAKPAVASKAQHRDACGTWSSLLECHERHRCLARGRWPSQRARQAFGCAGPRRPPSASEGIVLLTSRVSVEMVQKAATMRGARDRVRFRADGAGRSDGRCGGNHTCRHCARGWIRSVHASRPDLI